MAGYLIILLAVIFFFSEEVMNLTVIIGAFGVGIGFALRELIHSLIGWAIIDPRLND